ncbi:Sialic acid-specific 9-O-acetylesterase [Acidisarcina polymorpha]|uniref:Sialic acid-specific 9-O-acetylesterase n=1 Tax=Acidisarcina polymorpha TaxID=2211140 RepID=A0A2Z5FUR5_9BACT|nr:sialate O-acetylesterase [Acidisarcina polymorpha]AXC10490.1 Sialic acid-specific 9-O-acetylesterase [Acidisarcina polymorpha]
MNQRQLTGLCATLSLLLFAPVCLSEVRLPKLLSDHVVLQRDAPIHIWGWADPGEPVNISFTSQKQSTTADELGKWSVYLSPEDSGGPYVLTVQGANTVTVSDVLVGDVWFASGQSNMQMPLRGFPKSAELKNSAEEIANANQPQIRLLRVHDRPSDHPLPDLQDADEVWTTCTPETAADFSAVAYFFGREIQQHEKVPIGLVDDTWGGTPAESWISLDGISANASLMPIFQTWSQMSNTTSDIPALRAIEKRADDAAKQAGLPPPKHPWHPVPASYDPSYLYNGMIAPFVGFRIKGVIWYQGETNSGTSRAPMYSKLFPTLINDCRSKWGEGDFPFLFVQISSFKSNATEIWGIIRDAQRRTLSVANTGMAVTLDVGNPDNVHPADKQTVGHRLALTALDIAYGEHIEDSGPLFREASPQDGQIRVWFDHSEGLSAQGGAPSGFEVAGEDHKFVPATAKIDGQTIVASAPEIKSPKFVRYAWANVPAANLYNRAGLPASTFSSENGVDAGTVR